MAGSDEVNMNGGNVDEEVTPLLQMPSTLMGADGYPRKMGSWPRPLVVALVILGIWRPGTYQRACRNRKSQAAGENRRMVTPRVYHDRQSSSDVNENRLDSDGAQRGSSSRNNSLEWSWSVRSDECHLDDTQCDVCSNKYEVLCVSETVDTASPAVKTKTILYEVLLLMYLLGITSLMTYDFAVYINVFWGKRQSTLLLVSYFTYLFQVFVVPVFVLLTRFLSCFGILDPECIWAAIHNDFIFKRSQYLHGSSAGVTSYGTLAKFLAWPIFNGVLRIFYDDVYRPGGNAHSIISHWCALVSYVIYGAFCCLMYVERRSFQKEFRVITHFVASNAPKGDAAVDVCRDRLSAAYRQYRVLREFVSIWMAFTMTVATWGITAHMTWNYVIFSYCDPSKGDNVGLPMLNGLVWSQKIMFFVLPSLAVGGLNIDYVWMDFRYILANHQRFRYGPFWQHIKKHVSGINLFGKGLSATIFFSVLGLYLGLELNQSSQDVAFWNGPGEFNMSIFCRDHEHGI